MRMKSVKWVLKTNLPQTKFKQAELSLPRLCPLMKLYGSTIDALEFQSVQFAHKSFVL